MHDKKIKIFCKNVLYFLCNLLTGNEFRIFINRNNKLHVWKNMNNFSTC